ncbi:MAG: hypothetical protein KatS3mg104_0194 [Phycisphaerae bacterium]|jgi:hypothetical protein|nr:MAG: hypothetical protein KatS3mg104_0194 [Phycisphaerae bacterium]
MAVSKSWSSDTYLHRQRKYFTLAEANRTLPLVRRIVADIVSTHETATHLHAQLENRDYPQSREDLENQLEQTVDRLNDLLDELKAIGCELKDYRMGLVDFPSRHQGREIYLCWRLGEQTIGHWHELHTGFQGRQPVELLTETNP